MHPLGPLASVPQEPGAVVQIKRDAFWTPTFTSTLSDALLSRLPAPMPHFKFAPGTTQTAFIARRRQPPAAGLLDRDFDFPLHGVDLLVLSACETAMGGADGTEVEGLAGVTTGRCGLGGRHLWPWPCEHCRLDGPVLPNLGADRWTRAEALQQRWRC